MAQLYPFRALRYNTSQVDIADVVTQPYDKISPAMQDAYYARSPYNLIRVILGKRDLDGTTDTDADNVYTRAAATLAAWRADGILQEESEPALFGYSQTYLVPGTQETSQRRGFIALGHLHDYADHVVFRHEQTFPKHKSDRLALFKATRTYCEQIYMLYSDPTFTAEHLLFDTPDGQPRPADLEITDEYNVLHRVWKLTDPHLIGKVLKNMSDKKLIIADGHHRYETSVAYMHERAAALGLDPNTVSALKGTGFSPSIPSTEGEGALAPEASTPASAAGTSQSTLPAPPFPEAAMMMTFVNMDAPGITILPTHRVLSGFAAFDGQEFAREAQEFFTVTAIPPTLEGASPTSAALLTHLTAASGTAFLAVTRAGSFLLTPRPEAIASLLSDLSPRQAALDVTQLHRIILDRLLGLNDDAVRSSTLHGNSGGLKLRFYRDAGEAVSLVQSNEADIAFLIKPVTLAQMRDISLHLEVMPQKSTDFYPKLLSGLAMYTLD